MKKKPNEEKSIESNVGITYRALSQFFALVAVIFMITASVSYAVMANPLIWTTDAEGTNTTDFAQEEDVYIQGSGFASGTDVNINVTRPTTDIDSAPGGRFLDGSLPTTDETGSFSDYVYQLNGDEGLYTIDASDGINGPAQTTFTDRVNFFTTDSDYSTKKYIFPQAGTAYASATLIRYSSKGKYYLFEWYDSTSGSPVLVSTSSCMSGSSGQVTHSYSPLTNAGAWGVRLRKYSSSACSGSSTDYTRLFNVYEGQLISPTDDTYVIKQGYSYVNTNYNNKDLYVKAKKQYSWSTLETRRTYLKFDLTELTDCSEIISAKLHLDRFTGDSTHTIYSYRVSNDKTTGGAWTETNLVWSNAPTDFSDSSSTSVDNINGGYIWDVTTAAQNAFPSDLSLALKFLNDDTNIGKNHDFYDRERTGTGEDPYLEVVCAIPAVCGDHATQTDCEDAQCYWCPNCSGYYIFNGANQCVNSAQDCSYNGCDVSTCGAQCDAQNLCLDTECDQLDGCQGNDWYDYQDVPNACLGDCTCETNLCGAPTITPNDARCTECQTNADCDNQNVCTDDICNQDTYTCDYLNNTNPCDDGLFCTVDDVCSGGSCQGGGARDCSASGDQCNDGVCDEDVNACVASPKPDQTPCNDGLFCTDPDACTSGVCSGHARGCSDRNECTDDNCIEGDPGHCENPNLAAGTECGSARDCPDDKCEGPFAWFYPDDGHDTCDGSGNCVVYSCAKETSYCTDNDSQDGINGLICGAQCDQNSDCQPHISGDWCYYDGTCELVMSCECNYFSQYCPEPGTVDGEKKCWYDPDGDPNNNCVNSGSGGCTLMVTPMGCKDTCDPVLGPIDTIGPTTSNTNAVPYYNNGIFNLTSHAEDTCSNIERAEYFVGHVLGSCGFPGTGTPMEATDAAFDELIEDLKKDNVNYLQDGLNFVCVQSKDSAGNWGNCDCAYFETDVIPPDYPYNIYLDDVLYPNEYLVCGDNPWLNATVCDVESDIQGGEYFLDITIPPIPAPWSGYWMNVLYPFIRPDGYHCAVIGALVDTSQLEDGTHYIAIRGKDSVENWGKISQWKYNISFIRDTMAPETFKQLNPTDGLSVQCYGTEASDVGVAEKGTLTNGCAYVKQGTQITLTATDPDPQGTGEFAGNVIIYYRVWWKNETGDSWQLDQEGQSAVDQSVTITLNKDSYHLIEYWSVDLCGWEETHHFELDIVDTQDPVITKTITGPQVDGDNNPIHKYLKKDSTIVLDCVDEGPHPVDDVILYWEMYWKEKEGDAWVPKGSGIENSPAHKEFTQLDDSYHKFVYRCEDALGNTDGPYTEIDAVDTVAPIIEKEIVGPWYGNCPPGQDSVNQISFLYEDSFEGVDDHSGWSTSDSIVNLGTSTVDILSGNGLVIGYKNGGQGDITHRGTRGLGVYPGELDEVDDPEKIEIEFDSAQYIDSIELRSLFSGECNGGEKGHIDFYNGASLVYSENPVGVQLGGNGIWSKSYDTAIIADKIIFYAENDSCSEFAVARIGLQNDCYIDGVTEIHVSATDPQPHPVNQVTCDWDYEVIGGTKTGSGQTDVVPPFVISFPEESKHVLTITCEDALGNQVTDVETFLVDKTAPTTTKTYGTPLVEAVTGGYPKWITSATPITLTVEDTGVHKSGIKETKYRVTLLGSNEACESDSVCQQQTGSGSWNTYTDTIPFTIGQESCHLIEYYSVDNVNKTETVKKQCVFVENTPPVSEKILGDPKHACTQDEQNLYYAGMPAPTDGCYFITQQTPITLTCSDGDPHPVDHVKIFYRDYLVGECPPVFTEVDGDEITFYKLEDSAHILEWYCIDELGNKEETHVEYDIVDTVPPETTKEIIGPKYETTEIVSNQVVLDFEDLYGLNQQLPTTYAGLIWGQYEGPLSYWRYSSFENLPLNPHSGVTRLMGWYSMLYVEFPQPVIFEGAWFSGYDYGIIQLYGYNGGISVGISDVLNPSATPQWLAANFPGPVDRVEIHVSHQYAMDDFTYTINEEVEKTYIDGITEIELTCVDPLPHPVNHEEIYYRYFVDDVLVKDWTKYTEQFSFPEESKHDLEYYCVDALGNTEEVKTETDYVDHTPPVTTKTYGQPLVEEPTSGYPKWITSQTSITLTATDGDSVHASGVAITYWRNTLVDERYCSGEWDCQDAVGTGSFNPYVEPFFKPEESCHLIEYYSIDNVEKTETVKKQCVYVDNTPPDGIKTVGEPKLPGDGFDYWVRNHVTEITLDCVDPQPHPVDHETMCYKISFDDPPGSYLTNQYCTQFGGKMEGDWCCADVSGTNKYTFTFEEDSLHDLEYYCIDALGNENEVDIEWFRVDSTPPETLKTVVGPKYPASEPDITMFNLVEDQITNFWIMDKVTVINLDATDYKYPCDVGVKEIHYRICLDENEDNAFDEVECEDWIIVPDNHVDFTIDEDCLHKIEWFAVDLLGNTETTNIQYHRVDSQPPVTTKTIGDPKWWDEDLELWWVTSDTEFTLTAVDKLDPCAVGVAGFHVKIEWDSNCDGTVDSILFDQDIQEPYQYQFKLNEECLHKITWYSFDKLGNVEAPTVQYHKVDNTPPHILIIKPVNGWYSDGEDIAVVAVVEDLTNPHGPCEEWDILSGKCAVGIEDGTVCNAYLIDLLPEFKIVELESHMTYNASAHECQGYVTIPDPSEIPDGAVLFAVSVGDNLGNMGDSMWEIYHIIMMKCGEEEDYECIIDVVQDIVTIWNLPKIGIDNHAPEVDITMPEEGTLFGGEQLDFSADVSDAGDGDVTSTITSGTPCYVSVGGISLGTVPYNNIGRTCSGAIMIPQDEDFPQETQPLTVEIADNAGNIGSDTIMIEVDTVPPAVEILNPSENEFVSGLVYVTFSVFDANYDTTGTEISLDNGQTWIPVSENNPNYYLYGWDTTAETDGMAYGIIARSTDEAGNTGYSEIVIVIVDNGEPESIYVVNPIKNDIVTGQIEMEAVVSDTVSGVTRVEFYIDSAYEAYDENSAGGWTATWSSSAVDDGMHTVYAIGYDNMGNSKTSNTVSFIVDNNAPTTPDYIYFEDPDDDGYDKDGVLTLRWGKSSDDGAGMDYYEVIISSPGYMHFTIDAEEQQYTPFVTLSDLYDGEWYGQVRAWDKAGHSSEWTELAVIIVDMTPPEDVAIGVENYEKEDGVYYDIDSFFDIYWSGGNDDNFDEYRLYENGIVIYSGEDTSYNFEEKEDGTYKYYVEAVDEAGWKTKSDEVTVIVDTQNPDIEIGESSGFLGMWTFTYTVTDPEPSSGIDKVVVSNSDTPYVTCFSGWCMVIGGTYVELTVYDNAGNSDTANTEGAPADTTPPMVTMTSPSGIIEYNEVTLKAETNEPSRCYYGATDDLSTMTLMDNNAELADYGTEHWAYLGILPDGAHVYHVQCEDTAGNMLDSSKTIVFFVHTEGQYCYVKDLDAGWNTFFLPKLILEDMNFQCGDEPYEPEAVLASLYSEPKYSIVWYYDGVNWLFFDPAYPEFSTLTEFSDVISSPYYIKMNQPGRLELVCEECNGEV